MLIIYTENNKIISSKTRRISENEGKIKNYWERFRGRGKEKK